MPEWSRDLCGTRPAFERVSKLSVVDEDVASYLIQQIIPKLEVAAKSIYEAPLEVSLIYYNQLLKAVPGNGERLAPRAQLYLRLNDHEAGLRDANRVVEKNPKMAQGHRFRAEPCDGFCDRSQAFAACWQALIAVPNDNKSRLHVQLLEEKIRSETSLYLSPGPRTEGRSPEAAGLKWPEVKSDPALFNGYSPMHMADDPAKYAIDPAIAKNNVVVVPLCITGQ